MTEDLQLIYITAGSREEARTLAEALVAEELVACVNILGDIESVYRWDGKVQRDSETALLAKTTRDRVGSVTERVKAIHSYECPCVVSISINGGNEDFHQWIRKNVQ